LKNYSSGMQVRLAFSIAIQAQSDILVLDEVLAVGDANFQRKCFEYFKQLKHNGQTVILVSHDSNTMQEFCTRGILLEEGRIICKGGINDVILEYSNILNQHEAIQDEVTQDSGSNTDDSGSRWGTGEVRVQEGICFNVATAKRQALFSDKEDEIGVGITYRAERAVGKPVYGITVTEAGGQRVFQSNTMWSHERTADVRKGGVVTVEWVIPNVFGTGEYIVTPAVADEFGNIIFDWHDDLVRFKVRKRMQSSALINVKHAINFK
ncbi:MAG TPA: Wzt carbohydrate-binding domain-containing protein, partial [Candidatus Limnocylindrales bacterium]|nr:Wzt carbohydrate-binding domain-containing protein [Candidatus Limnocylindrales bacterium]